MHYTTSVGDEWGLTYINRISVGDAWVVREMGIFCKAITKIVTGFCNKCAKSSNRQFPSSPG